MLHPNMLKRLHERLSELRQAKEDILRAVREEDMVDQMLSFYAESDSEDTQMRDVLIERLSALRASNDEQLPRVEEESLLSRLLAFYHSEANATSETLQQRREGQRLAARRQLRMREDQVQRRELEARRDREVAEVRARSAALRLRDATEVSEGNVTRALSKLAFTEPDGNQATSASSARQISAAPEQGSHAYQIGNAVREYLVSHGTTSAPFTVLFSELRHVADSLPSSTEKAKIEAFRYHLRRAGKWFGLRYDRGNVELMPVESDLRIGGEAALPSG